MFPLHKAGSHPFLRFAIVAIGHPMIFLLYIALYSSFKDSVFNKIPFKAFVRVETNVDRINLWMYAIFAFFVYYVWLQLELLIFRLFKKINEPAFLAANLSANFIWISSLNIFFNLIVWVVHGMEGNIFGFIIVPGLILLSIAMLVFSLIPIKRAISGKYV